MALSEKQLAQLAFLAAATGESLSGGQNKLATVLKETASAQVQQATIDEAKKNQKKEAKAEKFGSIGKTIGSLAPFPFNIVTTTVGEGLGRELGGGDFKDAITAENIAGNVLGSAVPVASNKLSAGGAAGTLGDAGSAVEGINPGSFPPGTFPFGEEDPAFQSLLPDKVGSELLAAPSQQAPIQPPLKAAPLPEVASTQTPPKRGFAGKLKNFLVAPESLNLGAGRAGEQERRFTSIGENLADRMGPVGQGELEKLLKSRFMEGF
jgi:hypothetical protein